MASYKMTSTVMMSKRSDSASNFGETYIVGSQVRKKLIEKSVLDDLACGVCAAATPSKISHEK